MLLIRLDFAQGLHRRRGGMRARLGNLLSYLTGLLVEFLSNQLDDVYLMLRFVRSRPFGVGIGRIAMPIAFYWRAGNCNEQ